MIFGALTSGFSNGATSTTISSPSVSSTNTLGIVGVFDDNSDTMTGVTWDGTAMTEITPRKATGDGATLSLWYIIAPTAGVKNIVASRTGSLSTLSVTAAYYNAVKQSAQPDAKTTNSGTGVATLATSLTTIADKTMTVLFAACQTQNLSAGTGTTLRTSVGTVVLGDSNTAITPAGSYSMTITPVTNGNIAAIMASFAPFTDTSTISDTSTSSETVQGTITSSYADTSASSETLTTRKNGPQNVAKDSATFSNVSKNNASPSNTSKNSSTWTDLTKN